VGGKGYRKREREGEEKGREQNSKMLTSGKSVKNVWVCRDFLYYKLSVNVKFYQNKV
jgi:hypothetical protein